MSVIFGTIYYADYYDPDCDAERQAAYLIGNYAYPAECPDCVTDLRASQYEFPGMQEPLPVLGDSLHDATKWTSGTALRSVTKACSLVDSQCRPDVAGFVRISTATASRYAIVVSLESTASNGLAKRGERNGVRYLALEVDDVPEGANIGEAIAPARLPGGHCYRAKYELSNGQQVPVLILLARPN